MKPIEKRLDDLWSKAVKARDGHKCVYCHGPGTESHHLIRRSHKALRWDIRNGVTLCTVHHRLVTDGHIKLNIPNELSLAKNRIAKYSQQELLAISTQLKGYIANDMGRKVKRERADSIATV